MARLLVGVALVGLIVVTSLPAFAVEESTIYVNVTNSSNLTIMSMAIKEVGMAPALNDPNHKQTLFAPTDQAFKNAFGEQEIKKLVTEKDLLKKIVKAHLIDGVVLKDENLNGLDGQEFNGFRVSMKDGFKIGSAAVKGKPRPCSNGTTFVIDRVLLPSN